MYHTFGLFTSNLQKKFFTAWAAFLQNQQTRLFHWIPVFLGLGIGLYFGACWTVPLWLGALALLVLGGVLWRFWSFLSVVVTVGASFCLCLGFLVAQMRVAMLETPMLTEGTDPLVLEGRVVAIEQQDKALKLTLDALSWPSLQTPLSVQKVKVTARGRLGRRMPEIGARVQMKAVLLPPKAAGIPGAYDLRRKAFFEGIGATGYALTPPQTIPPAEARQTWWDRSYASLQDYRHRLTQLLRQSMPGEVGAIAAALITGDRAGISEHTRTAFADAGIAHILAISGLHLSIISGFIFLVVRGCLSLIPPIAVRFHAKKIAAAVAMIATTFYLLICGNTIPAQRAKIMTTLLLLAILVDRRAITLRSVSLAAIAILLLQPEALVGASFQLSFAAVVALVCGYELFRTVVARWQKKDQGVVMRFIGYFLATLTSSILATLATTPFTVFIFHKLSLVGIASNLLAIPLVSFAIMPLLVIFIACIPLSGLPAVTWSLSQSLEALIQIADISSRWPGAYIPVPIIPASYFLACVGGMLWLCLWRGSVRWWGSLPILLALYGTVIAPRPQIFVSEGGRFVGVVQKGVGYVNTLSQERFLRKVWTDMMALQTLAKVDFRQGWHGEAFDVYSDDAALQISWHNHKQTIVIPRAALPQRGGTWIHLKNGAAQLQSSDRAF